MEHIYLVEVGEIWPILHIVAEQVVNPLLIQGRIHQPVPCVLIEQLHYILLKVSPLSFILPNCFLGVSS